MSCDEFHQLTPLTTQRKAIRGKHRIFFPKPYVTLHPLPLFPTQNTPFQSQQQLPTQASKPQRQSRDSAEDKAQPSPTSSPLHQNPSPSSPIDYLKKH